MSTTWTYILLMVFGIFPVALLFARLIFKKSILFKTAFSVFVISFIVAISSFILGRHGLGHLYWYIPAIFLILLMGNIFFRTLIKFPLEKAGQAIDKISKGDIDINPDDYLDGSSDEIEKINESLGNMVEYVRERVDFAEKLGRSELDAEHKEVSEADKLGKSLVEIRNSLRKAREEEKKRQEEDRKRQWVNEGIAKFADLLRKNNEDLNKLSYSIISNLVKYLEANQGGIFLLNDEDENDRFYELKAAIAYDRRKYINKQIRLGEGLVGTCAIEGETIYMTDIPQDYINITSGLGNANPDSLLIVPLKTDEEVLGVLEIASFSKFEQYQIDFVEKVAENIASTVYAVKVNIRTNQLLEKSQQQAEELKSQEEEMRQNMEEMQTTKEESERRSEKIKEIASEVYEEEDNLRAFIGKMKETD